MNQVKNVFFCISILVALNASAQSSFNFTNQFSVSQKVSYSKSIELLSYSNVGNLINQGNAMTVLLQDNDFFNRLSAVENNALFNQHDTNAINNFLNAYSLHGFWDLPAIAAAVNANGKMLQLNSISAKPIQFSRHLNTFLVVQPDAYEANVLGTQNIVQSVFLFL